MTLGEYLPNSNTKLLLHLNGNSTDSSGNGNNGTDTNITYSQANGRFGMGAGFTTGSSIVNSTPIGTVNADKTISIWAKIVIDYTSNANTQIFSLNFNTVAYSIYHGINAGVSYFYETRDRNGISSDYAMFYNPTAAHGFYNLLMTLSGTTLTFYIDGNQFGQTTINTGNGATDSGTGYKIVNGGCNVDEVIIENRAWSASEVKKYYTNSRGFYATL